MWCPSCQADVAAEVSADHQRVRCASCGAELAAVPPVSASEKTKHALELLERWSNSSLLDPYGPVPKPRRKSESEDSEAAAGKRKAVPSRPPAKPHFRLDAKHELPFGKPNRDAAEDAPDDADASSMRPVAEPGAGASSAGSESAATTRERESVARHSPPVQEGSSQGRRIHPPHESLAAPHFDVRSFTFDEPASKPNVATQAGQYLAYLGVGTLAIGTILVLWGYFGGPEGYAPTGWLIATAGQMLLFLGVVTLVSGGMDQTNHDVKTRIERLGEQILRFEQARYEATLRGPHFSTAPDGDAERAAAGRSANAAAFDEQYPDPA